MRVKNEKEGDVVKLRDIVIGGGLFILVLFFAANGYVPVPQQVRDLWDRAWHKQVEPRQEEWQKQVEKYRTTPPPSTTQPASLPQSFSLTPSSNVMSVACTVCRTA